MRPAWEYEVLHMRDGAGFKRELNILGAAGWELISASSAYVRAASQSSGGGGGGSWPPVSGWTEWNAILRRSVEAPSSDVHSASVTSEGHGGDGIAGGLRPTLVTKEVRGSGLTGGQLREGRGGGGSGSE